ARELLSAFLEVARREVVRGVLASTRGEALPPGDQLVERHLSGCSQEGTSEIPRERRGPGRRASPRFNGTGEEPYVPDDPTVCGDSASTRRINPSTPRTRTGVPGSIGSPSVRPRHNAPFTKTGPAGARRPRASPTSPISPRWVPTIRSRDCNATVRANP